MKLLLLVTLCVVSIIAANASHDVLLEKLRGLKSLSPKESNDKTTSVSSATRFLQVTEALQAKVDWDPAANCLEVKNDANEWKKLKPTEIHAAIVEASTTFWTAVGNLAAPTGKQNIAQSLKGAAGKKFKNNKNNAGNWPLELDGVFYPKTYPQLIKVAQSHKAYQTGGFVYGDSDFVRCGKWLMVVDATSGPPRWYVQPAAGIEGQGFGNVNAIDQAMQEAYPGMFDGTNEALGHTISLADIRSVVKNDVNTYDIHLCALIYAQNICEVRRNHVTAIINPLIYDLMDGAEAGFTAENVFKGGEEATRKHPMSRAGTLAEVGTDGVKSDGNKDNVASYSPPLGGRAGTKAYKLENEIVVKWLAVKHANHFRVAANCDNHAGDAVDAAKTLLKAKIAGRVHENMGDL